MANETSAHPIQILREHVTQFEAAILLCRDKPSKRTVHRLRTMTRRIEAQFTLLSLLHIRRLPRKDIQKIGRLLKEIRRAAGQVRDLDVLRDLIAEQSAAEVRKDARQLRKTLKGQRTQNETQLLDALEKNQSKLALSLESLLKNLAPTEPLTLAPGRLATMTKEWFNRSTQAKSPRDGDEIEHLHSIRKTAKLARYLAENAPKNKRAKKLASSFESVQQVGGEWHDWLILADISRDQVGRSSPLTKTFTRRCEQSLAKYRKQLDANLSKA